MALELELKSSYVGVEVGVGVVKWLGLALKKGKS